MKDWSESHPDPAFRKHVTEVRSGAFERFADEKSAKITNVRRRAAWDHFAAFTVTTIRHRDMIETLKAEAAQLRAELAELRAAAPVYRGVLEQGRVYPAGSFVTRSGSIWYANEATSAVPGHGWPWTLACKAGRDGRDATPTPR